MKKLKIAAFVAAVASVIIVALYALPATDVVVTGPQTAASRTTQYAFPKYDSLGALIGDGLTPTYSGMAITLGGSSALDGYGGIYVWDAASTAETNAGFTVFAARGVTTGRWFALSTNAFTYVPPAPR